MSFCTAASIFEHFGHQPWGRFSILVCDRQQLMSLHQLLHCFEPCNTRLLCLL